MLGSDSHSEAGRDTAHQQQITLPGKCVPPPRTALLSGPLVAEVFLFKALSLTRLQLYGVC